MKQKYFLPITFLFIPTIAFAALQGISSILDAIKNLVNEALPITFGLALLFFFWSIARFILSEGNPSAKEQNRKFLIWSVLAMFVLISIWGIVRFIGDNLLGSTYTNSTPVNMPSFNGGNAAPIQE